MVDFYPNKQIWLYEGDIDTVVVLVPDLQSRNKTIHLNTIIFKTKFLHLKSNDVNKFTSNTEINCFDIYCGKMIVIYTQITNCHLFVNILHSNQQLNH